MGQMCRVVHTMSSARQETASAAQGGQKYSMPPNPLNATCTCVHVTMTSLHILPGNAATTKMLSKPAFCIVATNIAHSPVNFLSKQAQYAELLVIIPLNTYPIHQKITLHCTGQCFPSQGSSLMERSQSGPGTTHIVHPSHTCMHNPSGKLILGFWKQKRKLN